MKRPIVGFLEISSYTFIGSLDAEHFYGKIKFLNSDEQIEVQKTLSAEEAAHLTKKDGCRIGCYKAGSLTERFNTVDELVTHAIKNFSAKYKDGFLFKGKTYIRSPMWLLFWPHNQAVLAKQANALTKRFEASKVYDEEADDKWFKLVKHLFGYGETK